MSMTQDERQFRGMSKDFGAMMHQGLEQVNTWRKDIDKYGSPAKVKNAQTVKYGNRDYSVHAVSDLENDIAKDALAVAKMRQLYTMNVNAVSSADDLDHGKSVKTITLGNMDPEAAKAEMKSSDLRFGGDATSSTEYSRVAPKTREPIEIDEAKMAEVKAEIDSMVGVKSAKRELNSLINDAQIAQLRQQEGLPVENNTMHLVFSGDPGTGKTTFAKAIAKSYNALGILPSDKVTVVTRADLVGEYMGQTSQKTRGVFDDGRGGVIFIDEAYALNNGPNDSYGKEAIDEIVALSEERRSDTVVIVAGYPGDMKKLFETNPGLKSRFPRTVKFPNFSEQELDEVAHLQADSSKFVLEPGASKALSRAARRIKNAPDMSNARDTRNLMQEVSRAHSNRISELPREEITKEVLTTVTAEDIENAEKLFFKERTASVSKRLVRL